MSSSEEINFIMNFYRQIGIYDRIKYLHDLMLKSCYAT